MRLEKTRHISKTSQSQKARGKASSSAKFQIPTDQPIADSVSLNASSSISTVEGLLALQEVEDQPKKKQIAISRGHDMLDLLEELKVGILTGRITISKLIKLRQTLEERPHQSPDPKLDKILNELDLRVRVELAKLGY